MNDFISDGRRSRIPPTVYAGQSYADWCTVHGYDPTKLVTREAYRIAPRSNDPAPEATP